MALFGQVTHSPCDTFFGAENKYPYGEVTCPSDASEAKCRLLKVFYHLLKFISEKRLQLRQVWVLMLADFLSDPLHFERGAPPAQSLRTVQADSTTRDWPTNKILLATNFNFFNFRFRSWEMNFRKFSKIKMKACDHNFSDLLEHIGLKNVLWK